MKKIISAFTVVLMLIASIAAMIPISANQEAKGAYTPDWEQLRISEQYIAYDKTGKEYNLTSYHNEITMAREKNLLSANRKASGGEVSYISKIYFNITPTTKYQYDVMVQSHQTNKYGGVPFAISTDNKVYFLYGAFNNSNDSDDTNYPNYSYGIGAHGGYENKCTSSTDQANPKFFQILELDSQGFATLRFVYEGLTVTVMVKNSAGNYVQLGDQIPLESGSKVAVGVYNRNGDANNNRTVGIKNAVITGLNSESVDYMKATGVNVVMEKIEQPGDYDSTELEALIEEAEALNEDDYTKITYAMIPTGIEEAKTLLESGTATQSQIDAMVTKLKGRIESLVKADAPDDSEEDGEDNEDVEDATDAPIVQQPIIQQPIIQQPIATQPARGGRGCGMSVAATSVVIGIVATLGTALVIKKKD